MNNDANFLEKGKMIIYCQRSVSDILGMTFFMEATSQKGCRNFSTALKLGFKKKI